MKKIIVLSLLLLTGFVAVVYTKKTLGGDSILWSGTASTVNLSNDALSGTPRSDSVGTDLFNYSGGGLIDDTIPNDGKGNTYLKSGAGIFNSGSIDGRGTLQLDQTQQPSNVNLK